MKAPVEIAPAQGKLGILLVGLGAVSTTFIAGVFAVRKGLAKPIGSLTQMGTVRLGKRTDNRTPMVKDFVPLASLDDLVFGGWDIFEDNCYEAAKTAGVLDERLLDKVRTEMEGVKPMKAVFDPFYVKRLHGPNVKTGKNKRDLAEQVRADIRQFKEANKCDRLVMIWCGSTEIFAQEGPAHQDLASFEKALETSDISIPSSMIYAYAAIKEGHPVRERRPQPQRRHPGPPGTGGPDQDADHRQGLQDRPDADQVGHRPGPEGPPARRQRLVLDQHPGQPRRRGPRRSRVVQDEGREQEGPARLHLPANLYPDLYGHLHHVVRINYYPPRGDNKEGWDNIDLVGWLGYEMQLKINFLCRDSILAAPIVLDLVLFLDLARRAGLSGIQEWLSFYWKSPQHAPTVYPEHDLFIQLMKLKNTLRYLKGEELITHLGREYYD